MEELKTIGTFWLGGCSGCHMSFLDLDERLIVLNQRARIVASPLMDTRIMSDVMDIALVEGAVSMDEHLEQLQRIRERARILVAFGDCAINGNVTAMRNSSEQGGAMAGQYVTEHIAQHETDHLPRLLDRVIPLHAAVNVDYYLPGCPPEAEFIWHVLQDLLEGRNPRMDMEQYRYG